MNKISYTEYANCREIANNLGLETSLILSDTLILVERNGISYGTFRDTDLFLEEFARASSDRIKMSSTSKGICRGMWTNVPDSSFQKQ